MWYLGISNLCQNTQFTYTIYNIPVLIGLTTLTHILNNCLTCNIGCTPPLWTDLITWYPSVTSVLNMDPGITLFTGVHMITYYLSSSPSVIFLLNNMGYVISFQAAYQHDQQDIGGIAKRPYTYPFKHYTRKHTLTPHSLRSAHSNLL